MQQLSHPGLQHSYCLKDPLKPRSTLTSDPQTTFTLILSIDLHFLDISYVLELRPELSKGAKQRTPEWEDPDTETTMCEYPEGERPVLEN